MDIYVFPPWHIATCIHVQWYFWAPVFNLGDIYLIVELLVTHMLFFLHGMPFPPQAHFIQLNPPVDLSIWASCRETSWLPLLWALRAFSSYLYQSSSLLSPSDGTWSWKQGLCLAQDLSPGLSQLRHTLSAQKLLVEWMNPWMNE